MNYIYIGLAILFVGVAVYLTKNYFKKQKERDNNFIENKEYNTKHSGNPDGDFYIFYTQWCPYSKNAMNVYDSIRESYNSDKLSLNFINIDCDKDKDVANKYNIKDYPSYVLEYKGKKYVYDTNLKEETFYKFVEYVYKNAN